MVEFIVTLNTKFGSVGILGSSEQELLQSTGRLRALRSKMESSLGKVEARSPPEEEALRGALTRRGKAETSLVLQKMEETLLTQDFFAMARSTGDVRAELKKQTGMDFMSRKVSQALGYLFKAGQLGRTGPKGAFRYLRR